MMRGAILSVLLSFVGACAVASDQSNDPRAQSYVEIVATTVSFMENGVWYDFSDGAENYHSSSLVVLSPAKFCGLELHIEHTDVPNTATPWADLGHTYKLLIRSTHADYLVDPGLPDSSSSFLYDKIVITEKLDESEVRKIECELD